VTERDEETTEAEGPFDPQAKQGGSMGGGASGPRDLPTGGRAQKEGGSGEAGHEGPERSGAPSDRGQEEIESYGSRGKNGEGDRSGADRT